MNSELIINDWRLDPIPFEQRGAALQALEAGDIFNFFNHASNENSLWLLLSNAKRFQQLGLYEQAVLYAFKVSRTNHHRILYDLATMFGWADRKRLREAGQPLPSTGPFTLYRGVAGHGRERRIRAFSWTPSLESAQRSSAHNGLAKPAVYRTTVKEQDVFVCIKDGQEEEFILWPWDIKRIQLVCSMDNGSWRFTDGFRDFDVQQASLDLGCETNSKELGEEVHDN